MILKNYHCGRQLERNPAKIFAEAIGYAVVFGRAIVTSSSTAAAKITISAIVIACEVLLSHVWLCFLQMRGWTCVESWALCITPVLMSTPVGKLVLP